MIVSTDKWVNEEELRDTFNVITNNNTIRQFMDLKKELADLTDEEVSSYIHGVCDAIATIKLIEHNWRKNISKKYNVPYDFICRKGELLINKEEE